jgi:hypothetical protein
MTYKLVSEIEPISDIFNSSDCIYDIRITITFSNNVPFEFPSNCVLRFSGGKLLNGTLIGQSTRIEASPYQIFQNVTLQGSCYVDYAYLEWFGAIGNGSADDRLAIQAAINSPFIHLKLLNRTYRIDSFCEMQTNWDSQPIIERVGIVISKPKILEGLVAHTDKPTADGYPYYLYGCTHLTMESCSCEQCYYSFYFDCCRGCNIISLTDWRNFNFDDYPFQELTTEIKRQIYVNNSIAIGFLRCIIGTLSSTPQISVKAFLIKNSKNIVFDNCLLRSANYSIGGTMTDVTVASENCEIISSTVNFIPNN